MKESKISRALAKELVSNSGIKTFESKSHSLLLFNENYISSLFSERFDVGADYEQFEQAFRIVTNGVGNEIAKINSVISSSLLSLLVLYKLFNNKSDNISLHLKLNNQDYIFTQALFEVRNKVIGYPSCVDVVLKATDGTLLFLESKFTEYLDSRKPSEKYGSGYCRLYNNLKEVFKTADLSVKTDDDALVIDANGGEKYIEGIKQSISHLIGLVQGPQQSNDETYEDVYKEYLPLYQSAPRLIYGTVLFDPSKILPESAVAFNDYIHLYEKAIGNNGERIVSEIKAQFKSEYNPVIEVLRTPITYQQILKDNETYKKKIPDRILEFYQL